MSAPKPVITVASLPSEGILLIGSNSPEFESAFKPGRAKGYDPLLPYTVVIQNNTDQEIIAYSVVWNCKDATGKFTTSTRDVSNFSNLTAGTKFLPHSKKVVSLLRVLEAGGTTWDTHVESFVNRYAAAFSSNAAVDIALDAVLFADGSAIGTDNAHCIPHWKAQLEAEKEVFTKATQSSPSELPTVLNQLAAPGANLAGLNGAEVRSAGQLAVMAGRSNNYAEILDLERAYYAVAILDEMKNTSLPTLENLRGILQSKIYPEVHSKYAGLEKE